MSNELSRLKNPRCPECHADLEFVSKRKITKKSYNEYKYKCTFCTYTESLLGTGVRDKAVVEEAIKDAKKLYPNIHKSKVDIEYIPALSDEEVDEMSLDEWEHKNIDIDEDE